MRARVKVLAGLLFAIGVAVATAVVAYSGFDDVAALLSGAGAGLLVVVPWALVPILFAAASWRLLFAPDPEPPAARMLIATWVGLAVNWLLPVAQIGGEVVKARWMIRKGCPATTASASVVIDQTLQAVSQILYAAIGLLLMMVVIGATQVSLPAVLSALAFTALIILFYRMQRSGLFAVFSRVARRIVPALHTGGWDETAASLDDRIRSLYQDRRRMVAALALRMAFRVAMAGEVWLAMMALGHPVSIVEALIIESLTQMARGAAFMVPAGLGAQEGALVLVCGALGLGPDIAVALAAAKRLREVCVGVPGLLAWQANESGALRAMLRDRK